MEVGKAREKLQGLNFSARNCGGGRIGMKGEKLQEKDEPSVSPPRKRKID